ncbi:copper amine oxidase N-terminal domain-containing protein [Bacillota bacterium LX-D]|nr:copper amine oxidase N-terminal domain-containing protein [Bacillota bacterium LX-D]
MSRLLKSIFLVGAILFSVCTFVPEHAWAASSRVMWEWRNTVSIAHPGHVQVLENNNLLVTTNGYSGPAVLEVNGEKKTIWQYKKMQANSAVRLPNGNTLIADSGAPGYPRKPRVIEVNPSGVNIWQYDLLSRANAPRYAEKTPSGNVLIVTPTKIMEVGANKQLVWSFAQGLVNPVKAHRLSNGHTLIVDRGYRGGRVFEVDSAGQTVWHYGDGKKGTALGKLSGPTEAVRHEDGSTAIIDLDSARMIDLDRENKVTKIIYWQDVLDSLPILNLWGAALGNDGKYYLSLSYTSGKSAVVEFNDKSMKSYVDGQWIYSEKLPVISNGTIFVPAREFITALGAKLSWDPQTKQLTVYKGAGTAIAKLNSTKATLNGTEVTLQAAPKIMGSTLMVPLRLAAEACSAGFSWDETTKTINFTTTPPRQN